MGGATQQAPPVPPVDPDNEEFVIFVRSKNSPVAQWFPFNIVVGGSQANTMAQAMQGGFAAKLFEGTLSKNIGRTIYEDLDKVVSIVRERIPMLKNAKEFEFAYKIRDKARPAAWVYTDGIVVVPPEEDCQGLIQMFQKDPADAFKKLPDMAKLKVEIDIAVTKDAWLYCERYVEEQGWVQGSWADCTQAESQLFVQHQSS